MKLFLLFFTLMCVKDTEAQTKHHQMEIVACSNTDKEYMRGADGEEKFYADFEKKKGVIMLPPFADPIQFPGAYEFAESNMPICQQNLQVLIKDFKDQPVAQDAPQSSIYARDDIQLGSQNTLICHFTRFFPPPVRVRWTKNNMDVTDKSTLSQYYPNKDNTYNQFSHLPFTPQEGDVYTCTVEHKALQIPDTKTWEVDVELPSVGPAVFCGVGLAVGLLGVATGTFFLVKGNQCN
ncbi:H-2 class II histocompatibility antigen, I-E alpha chain-like [Pangasianodon hypophthalmus]|uniref:H-2 class II histocompatibility antigen, I-E alpha chain-like n=1 Tax=Pangasianodon hypophthalmus TaxID=310915 RepID=UPI0023079DAF|nr:H-2 class II histocompatibility antigen, I-E alpha chain-like [Pangasianodon hypophthalmus]